MMPCQLLNGKMCSCLHEKEQNKWELSGRDSCSERKVTCRVWFHFLMKTVILRDWGKKESIFWEQSKTNWLKDNSKSILKITSQYNNVPAVGWPHPAARHPYSHLLTCSLPSFTTTTASGMGAQARKLREQYNRWRKSGVKKKKKAVYHLPQAN